jgi:hypothetical protein
LAPAIAGDFRHLVNPDLWSLYSSHLTKTALKFDTIVVIEGLLATLFEKSKLF